jgi:hypothetical protein
VISRSDLWRFLAAAICAVVLARALPVAAQPQPQPRQALIGLYLADVHNLDFATGKFTADFWVWTVADADRPSPLESAYIVNEVGKWAEPINTEKAEDKRWDLRRIRADLWADWQVHRFPFDRQTLTILIEESVLSTEELVYIADLKDSGINPKLAIAGWSIVGWEVQAVKHPYSSSFGDPHDHSEVSSPRLVYTLTVQRQGVTTFVDLTIGAFVSFGVLALSFRLLPIVPPIFGARMVIIVGSMFTAMTSMRSLGSSYSFSFGETLPTRIHLATLAAGFLAALGAVIARYMVEKGNEALALRWDFWSMIVFTLAYIGVVSAEILHAIFFH